MPFDGFLDPRTSAADGADAAARLSALHQKTGALVHDFNNLLTVILNANEALASQLEDGSPGQELAQVSLAAAERGAELARRLMDLREEAVRPVAADCAEALTTTARRARLAASRTIRVEVRLTDAPLLCAVDGAALESALLNLCLNASHAMPAGGVIMLTARTAELAETDAAALGLAAGRYHVVSVADTGVGMSPETLALATEPYFTTRRGRGGTGLGLTAVRDFAEAAGGRFAITSREGRGTTARLYLPAVS